MKIYPDQLVQHLNQSLQPIYLLFGNEPLLKQEAQQQILDTANRQGIDEKHHFTLDHQLNWQAIYDECNALSLFSAQKIITLTLPETSLTAAQSKALKQLVEHLHSDIIFILIGERLNKKQESSQWFKLFNKNSLYVVCNTPDLRQMPKFISTRCHALGLKADSKSIEMLAQWHEGNLLALSQSLLKLQLLYPDGQLNVDRLTHALAKQNHFTPFQLIDALLAGNSERALQVAHDLEQEGVEITLLLRLLQKELIQLYKMRELVESGMSTYRIFEQFFIWQSRQPLINQALNRLSLSKISQLLEQLSQIEVAIKIEFNSQAWLYFRKFCLLICGHSIFL